MFSGEIAPFLISGADERFSGVLSELRIARGIGVAGMTKLMEGDVVQLKSGGPKMTVDGVSQLQAKCSWFNGAIRMSDVFELHSLRSLEDGVPKGITVSRMLDLDP
ncbi:MAG TPA: DUF2158 domain-containing protein [Vicinamibacterales bacterium]|nr:DUF2158 domain-containing protein [Vicinamibacterales bacterium]